MVLVRGIGRCLKNLMLHGMWIGYCFVIHPLLVGVLEVFELCCCDEKRFFLKTIYYKSIAIGKSLMKNPSA